ncbi:MAG: DUF5058 family protein [Ruminococcaceae bacterium]|nr:DUF5058 family protein [Oscillospiraceae bacterium]
MEFSVNHPMLFLLSGILVFVVLVQSVWFLVKALRRARELGMDKTKLKKLIVSAATFTVAPAIAIVISVMTLSKDLGVALPWMRLSVVGSLSYETIAASNAVNAMGLEFGSAALNASQFATVTVVMTLSIMVGIWLVPLVAKKMQNGMISMEKRDKKWSELFTAAMFIGMISAFVGFVFCDVLSVVEADFTGVIPVLVMAVSALIMLASGLLVKKLKWRWLSDYALPISLVLGMASAIPITAWLS